MIAPIFLMRRFLALGFSLCLLAAGSVASGQALSVRVQRQISRAPLPKRSHWGFKVVTVPRNRIVLQQNADRFYIPASNMKLYTTALALQQLGPDYRFETVLQSDAPLADGVIAGDLRIIGGGDPTMSWRKYPYEKGTWRDGPLAAIDQLAAELTAKGLKRITGDIIGDDTRWPWAPYPAGWALDDAVWEYGAPVSALTINENTIELTISPAPAPGLPALLSLNPPLEYYWIDNRIRTETGNRKTAVERDPGSRVLRLTGRVRPDRPRVETLAIDDSALYAAYALEDALTRRGVRIGGAPVSVHRADGEPYVPPTQSFVHARRESRPLFEIVQVVNKVSQNLLAEMLLREVGFRATGEGSIKAGLEQMEIFLSSIGVKHQDYFFRDGSGLSRMALTTPDTTVQVLTHMYDSPLRDHWIASLPIGGLDGTLETRFGGQRRGNVVKAKTGSISHVNTLSGYITSRTYGMLAFSIMVNGSAGPASEIRSAIDRICLEIAK